MSLLRRPLAIALITLFAFFIGIGLLIYISPTKWLKTAEKPEQPHEHYSICAEEDGRELMRVPIIVSIDDELITEDNKRYKIIRVEGNTGVARFIENVQLDETQQ